MIRPVIIVCKPPQTCLNPPDNDRCFFIDLPNQISIDDCRIIRTFSHDSSWCKGIGLSSFLRYRIMVDHRVHISPADQKSKFRFSIFHNACIIFPVRLGNDSHPVSICLQNPADDRRPKRWMIHIGIPDHISKIYCIPSSFFHILSAHWQKSLIHSFYLICFNCVSSCSVNFRYSPGRSFSSSTRLPIDRRFK